MLRGRVTDSAGTPIPYATIIVPAHRYGTLADSTGVYAIDISRYSDADTVRFSTMGYVTAFRTVAQLCGEEGSAVALDSSPLALDDVTVIPPKVKKKTFGRTSMSGAFEIQVSSGHKEGTGIGVHVKTGKRAWITAVSMGWIQREGCLTRMPFRLNIYKRENGRWVQQEKTPVRFVYTAEALDENGRFTYKLDDPLMIQGDCMVEFEFLEPLKNGIYIRSNIMSGHTYFHNLYEWESIPVGGSFAVHALVER